jgi:hypothetical protein
VPLNEGLSRAPLRVYTEYQGTAPDDVQRAMQEEFESIMAPIGWQTAWTPIDHLGQGQISVSLAVIRFAGSCDAANLIGTPQKTDVLGLTYVSDGDVLPYSDVNCDSVRAFLAQELASTKTPQRPKLFGRALGRVLAHELYHILTAEQRHGSKGVGESRFTPGELAKGTFRFASPEVQKLRNNLLPVLMSLHPPAEIERKAASLFITSGCAGCHGPQGGGTFYGPPLRAAETPRDLQARLSNSKSRMYKGAKSLNTRWPNFTAAEVELLSDYLRTLAR